MPGRSGAPGVGFQPRRVPRFIDRAGGQCQGLDDRIRFGRLEALPVQFQEPNRRCKTDSLVAIHEWMVFDEPGRITGRQVEQRRLSIREPLFRTGQR